MKSLHICVICATLLSGTWGCKGDPTADQRGEATSLSLVPNQIFIDQGKSTSLLAAARDEQLNTLAGDITAVSANPSVATVVVDSTRPVADGARHAYVVSGVAPGHTQLTVSWGAVHDTVPVSVLPLAFNGTISTLTPRTGDTVIVQPSPGLQFNPATVAVTFPGGQLSPIVTASATAVTVLAPSSDVGPLTIGGVVVAPGLELTLASTAVMHQTGDRWATATSWQTAPDITSMLPGAGTSTKLVAATPTLNNVAVCPEAVLPFGSSGPCLMFKFTLGAPTTLNFTTDWTGTAAAPDIDIYACSDSVVSAAAFNANCFEDGGLGATGLKPQSTGNHTYPAGTHYFVIETYAGPASRNLYTTISRP